MQMKRNSHTTSTKCQYQAAASKPKWRCGREVALHGADQADDRKMVPTITWKPWKPVARKKVEG